MFKSIRWRIAIPYILLITAITLIVGTYISGDISERFTDQTRSNLHTQALVLGQAITQGNLPTHPSTELSALIQDWSVTLDGQITVLSEDGAVLADSALDPQKMDSPILRPEFQRAGEDNLGQNTRISPITNQNTLYLAVPLYVDGQRQGYLRIAVPESRIASNQLQLRRAVYLVGAMTILMAVIFSYVIADWITKPLLRLTKSAQEMTAGDMDTLLVSNSEDEVGQLTRTINTLIKTLRDRISALQSERGKLSAVMQQMTDGVIIVNDNDQIELINPAAEDMFKITLQKALGQSAAETLRTHQWIDLLRESRETGQARADSFDLPGRDQFLQGIAIPFGETMPGHTLLLFQDLTQIKRLETTRQDFISNISHELRTPLASLKALTETLQSGALEDPAAANTFLSRIETEVDALAQMVSELLELSRIESGRIPLNMQPLTIPAVIEEAIDRLRAQAKRRQITIQTQLNTPLPSIQADPRRVEQVLVNLIHNAIKFSDPGDEIAVGARKEAGYITFFVEDEGIGIPAADLPRIFERFYKTDQARSSGGTGLGLAISKHLVEAHDGEIWAESEMHQGSTFYFSLPLSRE